MKKRNDTRAWNEGVARSEPARQDGPLKEAVHVDSSLYLNLGRDMPLKYALLVKLRSSQAIIAPPMQRVRNFSFRGEPIEFELACPYILLIDPLALDGLSADLQTISGASRSEMPERIRDLPGGLRIGLSQVSQFRAGRYQLANEDLEETEDEIDPTIFDIDSGTVCIIDLDHLGPTAKALTWDRYDAFLRSQVGDHSIWIEVMQEIGGPFFGMLNGDISTPFRGDGSYRLKAKAPRLVNP